MDVVIPTMSYVIVPIKEPSSLDVSLVIYSTYSLHDVVVSLMAFLK